MNIKLLITISILALLSYSSMSAAGCSSSACDGKIQRLHVAEGGAVFVGMSGASNLTCTPVESTLLPLDRNSVNFKEMYALLLTSKLSDQSVRVRVGDEVGTCKVAYVWSK